MTYKKFMPGLFAFSYPMAGRSVKRIWRAAMRAWCFFFRVRVQLVGVVWPW